MIEDINTILLYIFIILLLFCIMYVLFYSDQKISFDDDLDSIENSIENDKYKHQDNKQKNSVSSISSSKEKFESLKINDVVYYIYNPPESSRRVSDHWDQNNTAFPNYPPDGYYNAANPPKSFPGHDCISSMLDSLQGWSAKDKDVIPPTTKWLQIDLGKSMPIAGIVTQGRGPGLGKKLNDPNTFGSQSITEYQIATSDNGTEWTLANDGRSFIGNTQDIYSSAAQNNNKKGNVFSITTRYIRIIPRAYIGHPTMRVAILISSDIVLINNIPYIITINSNNSKSIQVNNTTYTISNPPESNRRVSDHHDQNNTSITNYPPNGYYDTTSPTISSGVDHLSSMLDTLQGWSAKNNDNLTSKWLQIDLGSTVTVAGIVTQGRGPGLGRELHDPSVFGSQSVTSYSVIYSLNNMDWSRVDNGSTFKGNTPENPVVYSIGAQNNTKIGNFFANPVSMRYIRIIPHAYVGYTTMRVGLLTIPGSASLTPTPTSTPTTTRPNTQEIYSEADGKIYLQSLSDFNYYIENNQNNLINILSTIQNAKAESKANNTVLMNSITKLYYKQYLNLINKINAAVYNRYNKSMNPQIQKIKL